jgi:hypothetical protein
LPLAQNEFCGSSVGPVRAVLSVERMPPAATILTVTPMSAR